MRGIEVFLNVYVGGSRLKSKVKLYLSHGRIGKAEVHVLLDPAAGRLLFTQWSSCTTTVCVTVNVCARHMCLEWVCV